MTGTESINRVSTEAVKNATGRTWDEWLAFLDKQGAPKLDHKGIVALLRDNDYISNGWWQQQVTVGYEIARGRRVTGETAEAGFEVGVQKTLDLSPEKAWKLITSPEGQKIWLGKAPRFVLVKGAGFRMPDGTTGKIAVLTEGSHIRLSWRPRDWDHSTTLQVRVLPRNEKAAISFHHEKLSGERERERMRSHWQHVLEQLEDLAVNGR